MIEKMILQYLDKYLQYPVYMNRPEKAKPPYVLLEKTGSSREGFLNHATIAIQSYAQSLSKAAELNEKVKELLDGIICLDEVCRSELNSDYNFTDITTKQPRCQAVYDITYY